MTTYYVINTGRLAEISDEDFARLQVNGKARLLRPYFVDQRPTPGPDQNLVRLPITVTETEARQSWQLVEKSQEEKDAQREVDERKVERDAAKAKMQFLRNGSGSNPDRIERLESVVAYLLRVAP